MTSTTSTTSAWTYEGPVASLDATSGALVLVEGPAFCVSDRDGGIRPVGASGFFFLDTRFLSRLELHVDGQVPEVLVAAPRTPFSCSVVLRTRPPAGQADSNLLVLRTRQVGRGLHEELQVRSYCTQPRTVVVELHLDADFADLFEVKEGRVATKGHPERRVEGGDTLRLRHGPPERRREAVIRFGDPPGRLTPTTAVWELHLEPGARWQTTIDLETVVNGEAIPSLVAATGPPAGAPAELLHDWERRAPVVDSDHAGLTHAVRRSIHDLGSLRLFDPDHADRPVLAAGAPWFMTLFGRDAILASYLGLVLGTDLALNVLEALARLQGDDVDPATEEQPGRILHEVRFSAAASPRMGDGHIYYGSIDATPLFVVLLDEVLRWGGDRERIAALLPHADRAIRWMREFGDADGDGYVEYQRMSDHGLQNQGWKDSHDGISFADGRLADTPIALCEVQGYVFAALRARAHLAELFGEPLLALHLREEAVALQQRFVSDFWLPERGWFAVGLDGAKRPIDSCTSNMGHLLWSGIVTGEHAALVRDQLLTPEMASGWGVRTLAKGMGRYNPVSYHNGSVWPHDTALIATGLAAAGFHDDATALALALLAAAEPFDGRLPELLSGLGRDEVPLPVPYPTSCSPQAWASAAPLQVLRLLLGFEPDLTAQQVRVRPRLGDGITELDVRGINLGGHRVDVCVWPGGLDVAGLPPGVTLVTD